MCLEFSKHAYCIIAHSDKYCLHKLVELLDDEGNDIYILIDAKADYQSLTEITTSKSSLYILPKDECIDIRWGDLSQIEAELKLFEAVMNQNDAYQYIHLISGQDLPIKPQKYIHDYFNKYPKGTNFIGLAQGISNKVDLDNKTAYYSLFNNQFRNRNVIMKLIFRIIRDSIIYVQKFFGFRRSWKGIVLYKGANWVSITPEFTKYLVHNKVSILKMFRWVPCADEIYKQTLAMNSEFKATIPNFNVDFGQNTRYIDFERGKPYTWRINDFDELIASESLFARKFSSSTDRKIIDKLICHLKK